MTASPLVSQLSFLEIGGSDPRSWRAFAGEVLGMSTREEDDALVFGMDEGPWRIRIKPSHEDGLLTIGWLAAEEAAVESLGTRLKAVGLGASSLGAEEMAAFGCENGLAFIDEGGLRHVVVSGRVSGVGPGSVPTATFVTGALGLGHIVMYVSSLEGADRLYLDALQMTLRENIPTQVGVGGHFYGCNPRHHSAAVVNTGQSPGVMHVMVEMAEIDDVGCALDRARELGFEPRTPLGRHRTDNMVSFYVPSPAGFDFEVGCGGLLVDDSVWADIKESTRRRPWGHSGIGPRRNGATTAAPK